MKHLRTAADLAGARPCPAQNRPASGFPPVVRRTILPAVRTVRRELGLTTGDLLVLDALLSFLPWRDPETGAERPMTRDRLLVVFASNVALSERANGMDERVLRRHIGKLCDTGLARRKMSATGKRFPLRRAGQIQDAFGIDLTPLMERMPELIEQADASRLRAEELRSTRAVALALRAQAYEAAVPLTAETTRFLDQVKTFLRRATLTLDQVVSLIGRLKALLTAAPDKGRNTTEPSEPPAPLTVRQTSKSSGEPLSTDTVTGRTQNVERNTTDRYDPTETPLETRELSGRNGQIVRQQEPQNIDIKKRGRPNGFETLWGRCGMVALLHPEPPTDERGLLRVIHEFGKMTRFDDRTLIEGVHRLGPERLLETLDYIAQNMGRIRCPFSYLDRIMKRSGHTSPERTMVPAGRELQTS